MKLECIMMGLKFFVLTVFMLMCLTLVYSKDTIAAMVISENDTKISEDEKVRIVKDHINDIISHLQTLPEKTQGNKLGEDTIESASNVCLKPINNKCFKEEDELNEQDYIDEYSYFNESDGSEEKFISLENVNSCVTGGCDGMAQRKIETSCSTLEERSSKESLLDECAVPENFFKFAGYNKLFFAPAEKIESYDGNFEFCDVNDHVGVHSTCNCSKNVMMNEIKAYLRPIHNLLYSIHSSLKHEHFSRPNFMEPSTDLESMFKEIRNDIKFMMDMIDNSKNQNNI